MVKRDSVKSNVLTLRYDDDSVKTESLSALRTALRSFKGLTPQEVEDAFEDGDVTTGRIKTVRIDKHCLLRVRGGSLRRILESKKGQRWNEIKHDIRKLFRNHTSMRSTIVRVLETSVGNECSAIILPVYDSLYVDDDGILQIHPDKRDRVRVGDSLYRKWRSSWYRFSRRVKEFEKLEVLLVKGKPQFNSDGTPQIVVKRHKKVEVAWIPATEDELLQLRSFEYTDQG